MSETTPDIDKYENADWWTVFRATQLCRELKQERDEARRELDLVSDKLCKSESAYLKNEEIIDGLKNEIEHTETFFREKLSRAADELNEAKRERDEARRLASVWEKLALREASINGEKICAKEEAKLGWVLPNGCFVKEEEAK